MLAANMWLPLMWKIVGIGALLLLTACDPGARLSDPAAEVGMRALIRRAGQDLIAEITAVNGNLVTTEFYWRDETVAVRDFYRGLYAVSGTEYGYAFELDFNTKDLDRLFPLEVGNAVGFSGQLILPERGQVIPVDVEMRVTEERVFTLKGGSHLVYVVDIKTDYRGSGSIKSKRNVVYFAPELSLVLKSLIYEDGRKSFWEVDQIDPPDPALPQTRPQRRSGSVMI